MPLDGIQALTFDVFGTVVDWRSSVTREGAALGAALGIERDWAQFADDWRARYQPAMSQVRDGERPWTTLDALHRLNLGRLLERYEIVGLSEAEIEQLNRAWWRLDPWPEAVEGLQRLRTKYLLATLSNGNVALMVHLARWGGLPWDAILGAEFSQSYKPQPQTYLRTAEALGLLPEQCLMVAAHNNDLHAARRTGLRTAFVHRRSEHGPNQTTDLAPDSDWDVVAEDFVDLAAQLSC